MAVRRIDADQERELLAAVERWVDKEVAPRVLEYDHADRYPRAYPRAPPERA